MLRLPAVATNCKTDLTTATEDLATSEPEVGSDWPNIQLELM